MLAVACGTTTAPSDGLTRAGQNKLVLTIVTGQDNPEEAAWFAKAVAEESAGAIEVKIDNTSVPTSPTYEQDIIKYVAAGKAQLGFSAARAFDSLGVTSFVGLHAPFLVDSYELEEQILASDWAKELLGGTRSAGVVGLGYIQGPMRQPFGFTRDLVELSDYNGARIGIRPSALTEKTMKALGATPVPFTPGDIEGLDGMEAHLSPHLRCLQRGCPIADRQRHLLVQARCHLRQQRSVRRIHSRSAGPPPTSRRARARGIGRRDPDEGGDRRRRRLQAWRQDDRCFGGHPRRAAGRRPAGL